MPLLIVAGEKDLVTEFKYTQELFNKVIAPEKKLKTYPEGRHELINDIEYNDVVDSVVAWTNETLAKHTMEPQCRFAVTLRPAGQAERATILFCLLHVEKPSHSVRHRPGDPLLLEAQQMAASEDVIQALSAWDRRDSPHSSSHSLTNYIGVLRTLSAVSLMSGQILSTSRGLVCRGVFCRYLW